MLVFDCLVYFTLATTCTGQIAQTATVLDNLMHVQAWEDLLPALRES